MDLGVLSKFMDMTFVSEKPTPSLAQFIQDILDEAGASREDLAAASGFSKTTATYMVTGERNPSRRRVHCLVAGLSELSGRFIDPLDIERLIHRDILIENLKRVIATDRPRKIVGHQELIDLIAKRRIELGDEAFFELCEKCRIWDSVLEAAMQGYIPSKRYVIPFATLLDIEQRELEKFVQETDS